MADFNELDKILGERGTEDPETSTASKLQKLGIAMQFFGSAFDQFAGGTGNDAGIAKHAAAIRKARETKSTLKAQTEGATKLVEHLTKFVDPKQHIEALKAFAENAPTQDIPMIRQAALALQSPREVADVQDGASVIAKLGEFKAMLSAIGDPKAMSALGISSEQAPRLKELMNIEGGLNQLAAVANTLPEDNPLHISDNELLQLQTNDQVAAQANQVLQAQPTEAFAAGETAAATATATEAGKLKKSDLLDENKRMKPVAVKTAQKLLGNIVGGAGIEFDADGNMRILDPTVGLQMGRMLGRTSELVRGGAGLPDATNQAAEEEGYDVSGKRAASTEAQAQLVRKNADDMIKVLKATANLTQEQYELTLEIMRQGEHAEAADLVEQEFGGVGARIGREFEGAKGLFK